MPETYGLLRRAVFLQHTKTEMERTKSDLGRTKSDLVVTGQQWVVDQAAWDETTQIPANFCSVCGWYSTNCYNGSDMDDHILLTHGGKASYYSGYVDGGTIHHDEVGHYVDITEDQWVQDSAAYDSQEIVGYQCSCGATQ